MSKVDLKHLHRFIDYKSMLSFEIRQGSMVSIEKIQNGFGRTLCVGRTFSLTLVCEINVPARINVPPGKFSKDNKRAPWKT